MKVDLCWTMKDTEPGKIKVMRNINLTDARRIYKKELAGAVVVAYARRFDGWHHVIHEWFYGRRP